MRGLNTPANGESGAIAVIVAVLMVVLLGFAAVSIDVSKLYSERAQLQNGADAAALLVAQRCAKSIDDADCDFGAPRAREVANQNAVDGVSNVESVSVDEIGGFVEVTTGAKEAGVSTNSVSMAFAGLFGFPTAEVLATSSARWGSPTKGRAPFPITVSICQVKGVTGVQQLLHLHGSGADPGCNYGPSGAAVPGGFGKLKEDSSTSCGAAVDITTESAGSSTGNDPPKFCNSDLNAWAADIQAGKDVIWLLPVFDSVTGVGDNAKYHITTIAAFKVSGWKLGSSNLPFTFRNRKPDVPDHLQCFAECRGIIGTFVEFHSMNSDFTVGPPNPDGAKFVQLTE